MKKPKNPEKLKAANNKARELGYKNALSCEETGSKEDKRKVKSAYEAIQD